MIFFVCLEELFTGRKSDFCRRLCAAMVVLIIAYQAAMPCLW